MQGVFHLDESTNLPKLVEIALTYRFNVKEVEAFRNTNSWKARFDNSNILS